MDAVDRGARRAHRASCRATWRPNALGALDRSLIDGVIKRQLPKIRYCYQRELIQHPQLAGKLWVRFTIATDGTVSEVTTESEVSDAVGACVADRFRAMVFPEPAGGGVVKVTYPFVFVPD